MLRLIYERKELCHSFRELRQTSHKHDGVKLTSTEAAALLSSIETEENTKKSRRYLLCR